MAEATGHNDPKRYAVVTGANKGIGFEICRQLASHGITVLLTARDEKRGLDAVQNLRGAGGLTGEVLFHQLDVADSPSVASLAEFIKNQFGRLDILVNNAGIAGAAFPDKSLTETRIYEMEVECLQTNYYGAKRMVEDFVPLLQLSQSPRIVNVSSIAGKLERIQNAWAKELLSDADHLTEERVDEVINGFSKDIKAGVREANGWPWAYFVSKASLNAYTRILAKRLPSFKVNCVCPGPVKTDLTRRNGRLTPAEGAESPVRLALLADDGPSGLFFVRKEVSSF